MDETDRAVGRPATFQVSQKVKETRGQESTFELSGYADEFTNNIPQVEFTSITFYLILTFSIFGCIFYIFDVISDCYIAYGHYELDNQVWCVWTCIPILLSGVVTTLYSMWCFYVDDFFDPDSGLPHTSESGSSPSLIESNGDVKVEQNNNEEEVYGVAYYYSRLLVMPKTSILFHIFLLAPIGRYIQLFRLAYKYQVNKHKQKEGVQHPIYQKRLLKLHNDLSTLLFLESVLESSCQLLLQLYIITVQKKIEMNRQIIGCCISLCVMAWSPIGFTRVVHQVYGTTYDSVWANIGSAVTHFLWRILFTICRILALALFASVFKAWLFLVILVHWGLMMILIRTMETTFFKDYRHERALRVLFDMISAFVFVFYYVTLVDNKRYDSDNMSQPSFIHSLSTSFIYCIIYYLVVFLENFLMTFLIYHLAKKRLWYHVPFILVINVGFIFAVFLQITYYRWFHHNKISKTFQSIRNCC